MKKERIKILTKILLGISILSFLLIFIETKANEGFMLKFLFEGFTVSGFWNKLIDLTSVIGLTYLIILALSNNWKNRIFVAFAFLFLVIKIIRHLIIISDIYKYENIEWRFEWRLIIPIVLFLIFGIIIMIQIFRIRQDKIK